MADANYHNVSKYQARRLLLLILILGAVIRAVTLSANDLWYDEISTIFATRMPLDDLLDVSKFYTAPPVYYILLKGWFLLTNDLFHPRVFTFLWSLLGIYFTYLLGRRLLNREVGLIAALFIALAPYHVRYSQEVRMYVMQCTLLTAETLVLLAAVRKQTFFRWVSYGFLIALNLALKYQSIFYCFAELLFLVVYTWRAGRRSMVTKILLGIAFCTLLLSPVIWIGIQQLVLADFDMVWVPALQRFDIVRCFLITYLYYVIAFKEAWWMWVLSGFIGIIIIMGNLGQWKNQKEKFALFLLLLLAIFPPLIMYVLSSAGFRIFFLVRYVIIALVPFIILIAAGVSRIRALMIKRVVFIILCALFMVTSLVQATKPWNPSWQALTKSIDAHVEKDDVFLANTPWGMSGYFYYSEEPQYPENFWLVFHDKERRPERFYLFQTNAVDQSGLGFPGYLPLILPKFGKQTILYQDGSHTFSLHEDVDFEEFREYVTDNLDSRCDWGEREDFVFSIFADEKRLNHDNRFTTPDYNDELWAFRYFTRDVVSFQVRADLAPGYYQVRLRAHMYFGPRVPGRDVSIRVEDIASYTYNKENHLFWYYSLPFHLHKKRDSLNIEVECPLIRPADYNPLEDKRRLGLRFFWIALAKVDLDIYRNDEDDRLYYAYKIGNLDEDGICCGNGIYAYREYDMGEWYRWTTGDAEFFLIVDNPDVGRINKLMLNLRQNHPDPEYIPEVKVLLNGEEIGLFEVGKAFENYVVSDIGGYIKPGINRLRLLCPTWRPSGVLDTTDNRDLGVQVSLILLSE